MKQLRFFFILMAWVCIHTAWGQVGTSSDPLYGKRIGVIGDSYVRNHREPVEYTWHYKFAKKHGMQYFNYGRNGNCVAMPRARFGEAMYKRYKEMTDSLDYVVVIAGHNDASLLDSIGIDNYKEKLGILCEGLIESILLPSCFSLPAGHEKIFQAVQPRKSWMRHWRCAGVTVFLFLTQHVREISLRKAMLSARFIFRIKA